MNTNLEKKYSGDGGNAQRIFIKDAQVGWKAILNDPQRHLEGGVAQYDYMESLYKLPSWQARMLLDLFLDKWSWTKDDNPYILEAIAKEEDRAVWRNYYMERSVYNLNRVYMAMTTAMPTRPDQLPELFRSQQIWKNSWQLSELPSRWHRPPSLRTYTRFEPSRESHW